MLNVAKVDCTSELGKGLCQEYEIRGYPTLIYFSSHPEHNNKYYKYKGMRSQEDLEKFALTEEWMLAESEAIPRHLEGFEWW